MSNLLILRTDKQLLDAPGDSFGPPDHLLLAWQHLLQQHIQHLFDPDNLPHLVNCCIPICILKTVRKTMCAGIRIPGTVEPAGTCEGPSTTARLVIGIPPCCGVVPGTASSPYCHVTSTWTWQ